MDSVVQAVAALVVLAAFALSQARVLRTDSRPYLAMNVVGASVLAVDAYLQAQWGFLLLEAVWALVAAAGLCGFSGRIASAKTPRSPATVRARALR